MSFLRIWNRTLLGVAALLAISPPVAAADYPSRPVTLVVAFTPGGPSDVLARIVGKKMEQLLGVPFVIENRPGAGGNLAAETVAHAAPDGYTLLMGNNSILATNESLYKRLNYSPKMKLNSPPHGPYWRLSNAKSCTGIHDNLIQ